MDIICLECMEMLESKIAVVKHQEEVKHYKFEVVGTGFRFGKFLKGGIS